MFGKRKQITGDDEVSQLANTLKSVSFFDGFQQTELHRVAQLAVEVDAEEGAVIIDQGRVGQEVFVILEGEAGVFAAGEHIATLGPGSMVGEMALVEHRPRNASVVAETPMKLVSFDTRAFKTLLTEMPEVNRRVLSVLASRLDRQTPSAVTSDGDGG